MQQLEISRINVERNEDLVFARICVRDVAIEMGFSHIDQVRLVTATSELTRNILRYGESGVVDISRVNVNGRRGLRVKFEDRGQGIADIELAMTDGYSTGRSLGKGLPGARRLVDDFEIESEVGKGTTVTITKWL
ncbi:MAG: anti-sigma regulatory factor [Blastocatellia bacterium]